MIIVFIELFTMLGLVFFTCEIGQRFSSGFDNINDVIDQFDWYSFPVEIKKMLPIIIQMAQQQVAIECFGSIMCLRDTFKKVSAIYNKRDWFFNWFIMFL